MAQPARSGFACVAGRCLRLILNVIIERSLSLPRLHHTFDTFRKLLSRQLGGTLRHLRGATPATDFGEVFGYRLLALAHAASMLTISNSAF